MSAIPTTSAPAQRTTRRMGGRARSGQIVLTVLLVICALVAVSTAFSDDPFPRAAVTLIATFGILAALFGLIVVWSIGTVPSARFAVWALPLFFVAHVALLGTWIPDAIFAVVSAIGALLAQPRSTRLD